ncbi:MAG: glycosyltransferase family 4 protein [Caldilineaceae bacterium]
MEYGLAFRLHNAFLIFRVSQEATHSTDIFSVSGLSKLLFKTNPAAVLLLGYHPQFYLHAFWQAWRLNYPLLLRAETTDHARQRTKAKIWLRDTFLRWFYRRFTALLPIGQHSIRHYDRLAKKTTARFFSPYCVDTTVFSPSEIDRVQLRSTIRHLLGINEKSHVILFSGKLIPKKAPEVLLKAVKQLPAEVRENVVVIFLGDGELRSTLEQLVQESPAIHTHFAGFQNQTALSPFYHVADMLVLPSRYTETWGLVINEALHHGVPSIVSDQVGCAPDLIVPGETGEIFASDNIAQLTAAIAKVLAWSGTLTVRERCRAQVANYTIDQAAAGIAQAFHCVTSTQHGKKPYYSHKHLV